MLDYNKLISLFPSGERLLLFVQTQSEIEGTSFNRASLLDNSGGAVQALNLTSTGDGGYIVSDLFTPPEIFQLQIHGFDSNGNPISRISSSGVQTVDVDLRLGKLPQYVQQCVPCPLANAMLVCRQWMQSYKSYTVNIIVLSYIRLIDVRSAQGNPHACIVDPSYCILLGNE